MALCACGAAMLAIRDTGRSYCQHCDGPCHRYCNPEGCNEAHGQCASCNAYRLGSKHK